jgi:Spy/CpxP family protein refolding chaperone
MRARYFVVTASLAAVILGVTVVGSVQADPGPAERRERFAMRTHREALGRLDLSQQQKDQLRASVEEARPRLDALRARVRADLAELRALTDTESPDPAAIGHAVLEVKQSREALRAARRSLHEATVALLSPEQRLELEGYVQGRRDALRLGPHRRL